MAGPNEKAVIDQRGYRGSERNRTLSPEEVMWARHEYYERNITTRQLAMKWGMSMASVGRILRGDTYANVGEALPRAEEVAARLKNAPAADRLLEELTKMYGGEGEAKAAPAPSIQQGYDKAVDTFLAGVPTTREPDPMDGEDVSGVWETPKGEGG